MFFPYLKKHLPPTQLPKLPQFQAHVGTRNAIVPQVYLHTELSVQTILPLAHRTINARRNFTKLCQLRLYLNFTWIVHIIKWKTYLRTWIQSFVRYIFLWCEKKGKEKSSFLKISKSGNLTYMRDFKEGTLKKIACYMQLLHILRKPLFFTIDCCIKSFRRVIRVFLKVDTSPPLWQVYICACMPWHAMVLLVFITRIYRGSHTIGRNFRNWVISIWGHCRRRALHVLC